MYETLLARIRPRITNHYPPVSEDLINQTEQQLGFSLPALLSECYLQLANGGFGPGYGVMGLAGGAASDFGNLLETYQQLKADHESVGEIWPTGLLPFCEWGCNIFSCVDCLDPQHPVSTFEAGTLTSQNYSIAEFFELWLNDIDLLDFNLPTTGDVEITNPFTGEKIRISKHKPDDQ